MKESDLRIVLRMLRLEWIDFNSYMVGKTFSEHEGEYFYYECDIEHFLNTKIL